MARGKDKTSAARSKSKLVRPARAADVKLRDGGTLENARIPAGLQQKCLNIFRDALEPSDEDVPTLQEVKGLLYDRNFEAAFGKHDYLRVYGSRWSPSRALAYVEIFVSIGDRLKRPPAEGDATSSRAISVTCLGGGAGAEAIGLAGWLHTGIDGSSDSSLALCVTLVDVAEWAGVVQSLYTGVTEPPRLSKYASAAAKDSNVALLPQKAFAVEFRRFDVLEISADLHATITGADLVTLMFTLNELYSTSIAKTQAFLGKLTNSVKPGAHLLVVDSPGSYSTVSINGAEKKYPMQWLLDHTLVDAPSQQATSRSVSAWEKVVSDDSRWFRLPSGLQYPIELENMRYQIHLYRRNADDPSTDEQVN